MYLSSGKEIERTVVLQIMPERPHYRPELISLLLPRYYSSSTWGVVGRSTLAGNGVSPAWFVGSLQDEVPHCKMQVLTYSDQNILESRPICVFFSVYYFIFPNACRIVVNTQFFTYISLSFNQAQTIY